MSSIGNEKDISVTVERAVDPETWGTVLAPRLAQFLAVARHEHLTRATRRHAAYVSRLQFTTCASRRDYQNNLRVCDTLQIQYCHTFAQAFPPSTKVILQSQSPSCRCTWPHAGRPADVYLVVTCPEQQLDA